MTIEIPIHSPAFPPAENVPGMIAALAGEGERELARELAAAFRSDTTARLADLRRAAERNDLATLSKQSHSIKGAALQLGASRVGALAAHVERSAKSGIALNYPELVEDLASTVADACGAMDRYLT